MDEAELGRVEHDARRLDAGAREVSDVDAFADERVPRLREVDADLVGAARLEAARDERRGAQAGERLDVRHRALTRASLARRAAQSVTSIGDERALDPRRPHVPVRERQVASVDRVSAKLRRERALRVEGPREHEQPRGLLVEALDYAERPLLAIAGARQQRADQLVERASLGRIERDGADPGGFVHHDDVVIDVYEDVAREARGGARAGRVG